MVLKGGLEDLNDVESFNRLATALSKAAHVHKAAHVAGNDEVRIGFGKMLEFQASHRGRDVRKTYGKCSAESAALLSLTKWNEFNTVNGFQEFDRRSTASSATCVAGTVKSDSCGKSAGPLFDSEAVD
jgi:hypothetical protein